MGLLDNLSSNKNKIVNYANMNIRKLVDVQFNDYIKSITTTEYNKVITNCIQSDDLNLAISITENELNKIEIIKYYKNELNETSQEIDNDELRNQILTKVNSYQSIEQLHENFSNDILSLTSRFKQYNELVEQKFEYSEKCEKFNMFHIEKLQISFSFDDIQININRLIECARKMKLICTYIDNYMMFISEIEDLLEKGAFNLSISEYNDIKEKWYK